MDQVVEPGRHMSKKAYSCTRRKGLSHQANKMWVSALFIYCFGCLYLAMTEGVGGCVGVYVCVRTRVCVCTTLHGNCQPPSMSQLPASKDYDRLILTPPVVHLAHRHRTELPGRRQGFTEKWHLSHLRKKRWRLRAWREDGCLSQRERQHESRHIGHALCSVGSPGHRCQMLPEGTGT